MEEQIKQKIKEQYTRYTDRYKKIIIGIAIIFFPIIIIVTTILTLQNSGWNEVPFAILKILMLLSFGTVILYKLITKDYRCLNKKNYFIFEAQVNKKKFLDEELSFVGIENEMRRAPKEYYLSLNNDEYFTKTKSWVFREVEEGKKYLFAISGNKKNKRSLIVCSLEIK